MQPDWLVNVPSPTTQMDNPLYAMRAFTIVTRRKYDAADGTEFVIREPSSSDARAMMKYINSVIREKRSGIIIDKPLTLKQEEAWLKERLDEIRKKKTVMLVAEVDGKIVGNCHVSRRPWKEKHRAMIGIALMKKARGRGIGKALMKETMDLSLKRMPGVESFDLSVLEYNEIAKSLYRSLGFVEVGCIPMAMREDGEYADEKIMVRLVKGTKPPSSSKRVPKAGR
jgi:RimJ/RimL family protein N-acetyltransferase